MECIQCGAQLREGARFCNNCGARQAAAEPPAYVTAPSTDNGSSSPAELDDGARVKRPARIPRASDDSDAVEAMSGESSVVTDLLSEAQMPRPDVPSPRGANGASMEASGNEIATQAPGEEVAEASPGDFYAAPAADETSGEVTPGLATTAEETGMPPLDELGRSRSEPTAGSDSNDGLPWPLPLHMIVGGRYRIESITSTMPDAPGAENLYLATDLQGYEQCWSCGTVYGQSASGDQYCRECGADMLAREYVMSERRASDARRDRVPTETGQPGEATEQHEQALEQPPQAESHESQDVAQGETSGAGDSAARMFTRGTRLYQVELYTPEPPAFPNGVRVVAAAATDAGQLRVSEGNEDSVGVLVLNAAHGSIAQSLALGIVADGLGGHVSGQEASRLVVRALTDSVLRSAALPLVGMTTTETPPDDVLRQVLMEGAQAANAAVYAANQASGGDMGSTLVAALICGDTAYVANAGDSRGYALDGGDLRRITTDHSLVEQLVAGGLISPADRYTHPKRNQIYRSLGDGPDADVDIFTQKLQSGMRLLLCSDGLWEMVHDDELAAILRETPNPREACDTLVRRANEQGGEDNISAVVIEVSA